MTIPNGFYLASEDRFSLIVREATTSLRFNVSLIIPVFPALPLRANGKMWHPGQQNPTTWALDGDGHTWASIPQDFQHGAPLYSITPENLLARADSDESKETLSAFLGLPCPPLTWQERARTAGWTPPKEDPPDCQG